MGKSSLGNLEEKFVAAGCYFPYIALLIDILVIVLEKQSRYCLFHGWQGLIVVIIYAIGAIIFGIVDSFVFIGFRILSFIWAVLFIILWIILIITAWTRAESGDPFAIPLIGRIAHSQADKRFAGGNTAPPTTNA